LLAEQRSREHDEKHADPEGSRVEGPVRHGAILHGRTVSWPGKLTVAGSAVDRAAMGRHHRSAGLAFLIW
jgi:hypothetical protein